MTIRILPCAEKPFSLGGRLYWADCVSALFFQRHHILSPVHYNNDPMVGTRTRKRRRVRSSARCVLSYFGSVNVMLAFQRTLSELYFAPRSCLKGVPFRHHRRGGSSRLRRGA